MAQARTDYPDLSPNFIALALKTRIMEASRSSSPTLHTELVTYFLSYLSDNALIDWEHSINTQSNLNSKVLSEILFILGLDNSNYLTKGHLIDEKLLGNRNRIVHGENQPIYPEDYELLHVEIIQLIEMFRTDIENAAVLGSYRR